MSQLNRTARDSIDRKHVFTWEKFVRWVAEHAKTHPDAARLSLEELLVAWSHMDDDPDLLEDASYSLIYRMYVDAFKNDEWGHDSEGKGEDHAESEASGSAEFIRGVTHDPIYNPNA